MYSSLSFFSEQRCLSRLRLLILALSTCAALSGCGFVSGVVKSELSRYDEPQEGERAHIRLIGSRNVKVYPNSTCDSTQTPGGGYPAGPQMGGQRKRDLGMPRAADLPSHYVEIAARAGQPITVAFSFYAEAAASPLIGSMPNTNRSAHCYVTQTLVPLAGANYDARAQWSREGCVIQFSQWEQDAAGQMRRVPIAGMASVCPSASSASSIANP